MNENIEMESSLFLHRVVRPKGQRYTGRELEDMAEQKQRMIDCLSLVCGWDMGYGTAVTRNWFPFPAGAFV